VLFQISFASLNDENDQTPENTSFPENISRINIEALETECHLQYNKAVRLQAEGRQAEAAAVYRQVLSSALFDESQRFACNRSVRYLQHLTLKNLAEIEYERGDAVSAVGHLTQALEIVDERIDLTLWYKLGVWATETDALTLARVALERCIALSPSTAPLRALALHVLAHVLYLLGDWNTCVTLLRHMLHDDPQHPFARALLCHLRHCSTECGVTDTVVERNAESPTSEDAVAPNDNDLAGAEEVAKLTARRCQRLRGRGHAEDNRTTTSGILSAVPPPSVRLVVTQTLTLSAASWLLLGQRLLTHYAQRLKRKLGDVPVVNVPLTVTVPKDGAATDTSAVRAESAPKGHDESVVTPTPATGIRRSQRLQHELVGDVGTTRSPLATFLDTMTTEWFSSSRHLRHPLQSSDSATATPSAPPSATATSTGAAIPSLSERHAVVSFVDRMNAWHCGVSTWMWHYVLTVTQWTESVSGDVKTLCRVLTQLGAHLEATMPLSMLLAPPHVVLSLAECHWHLAQEPQAASQHVVTVQRLLALLAALPDTHPLYSSPSLTLRLHWLHAHVAETESAPDAATSALQRCLQLFDEGRVVESVSLPLAPSLGPITRARVKERLNSAQSRNVHHRLEQAWRGQHYADIVSEHATLLTEVRSLWHLSRDGSLHPTLTSRYDTLLALYDLLRQSYQQLGTDVQFVHCVDVMLALIRRRTKGAVDMSATTSRESILSTTLPVCARPSTSCLRRVSSVRFTVVVLFSWPFVFFVTL
jgi:tetratricopeptide (TPR) repeat protein